MPVNQPVAQNGNGYAAQNVEAYAMQQVQPQEQQPQQPGNVSAPNIAETGQDSAQFATL